MYVRNYNTLAAKWFIYILLTNKSWVLFVWIIVCVILWLRNRIWLLFCSRLNRTLITKTNTHLKLINHFCLHFSNHMFCLFKTHKRDFDVCRRRLLASSVFTVDVIFCRSDCAFLFVCFSVNNHMLASSQFLLLMNNRNYLLPYYYSYTCVYL